MALFDEFPTEVAQAVDGLIWLGHLEQEVSNWGHSFLLKTLNAEEELEASLLAKDYQDTFGQVKATTWAHLAMALVAVDGDANYCPPIGPDKRAHARGRFNFITQWYWPVGEWLFGRYVDLLTNQAEAMDALDSLSNRSLRTSWPSQDSSTEPAASPENLTPPDSSSLGISPEQMKKLADSES